ncbi:MAG: hypothetical protein ACLVHE_06660 [Dialister invisus]
MQAAAMLAQYIQDSLLNTDEMNAWYAETVRNADFNGVVVHQANEININGQKQWGTMISFPWSTTDDRALGGQLYAVNSNGLFYRFFNHPDDIRVTDNWYQLAMITRDDKLKIGNNYIWFA